MNRDRRLGTAAIALLLLIVPSAFAQGPTSPPSPPSCELQLKEVQQQNATMVQLWRDISNQRGQHEVQMASIRAALGAECPAESSVSQCVERLHARYVDTAQRLVKAAAPTTLTGTKLTKPTEAMKGP